jgi:hypothetical protein
MDYRKMVKNFLLGESREPPNIGSYLQSLKETLDNLRPASQSDRRRLEIAKEHLREVKRHSRRLQEKVSLLEEKLSVLEEDVDK